MPATSNLLSKCHRLSNLIIRRVFSCVPEFQLQAYLYPDPWPRYLLYLLSKEVLGPLHYLFSRVSMVNMTSRSTAGQKPAENAQRLIAVCGPVNWLETETVPTPHFLLAGPSFSAHSCRLRPRNTEFSRLRVIPSIVTLLPPHDFSIHVHHLDQHSTPIEFVEVMVEVPQENLWHSDRASQNRQVQEGVFIGEGATGCQKFVRSTTLEHAWRGKLCFEATSI
jgi:hypothetical protein